MPAASTQGSLPSLRCVLRIICPYPILSRDTCHFGSSKTIDRCFPTSVCCAQTWFLSHVRPSLLSSSRDPRSTPGPSILGLRAPHLHHALRYASAQDVAAAALCCAQQPDHVDCASGAEKLAAQQAAGSRWRRAWLTHIALAVGRNRRGFELSASGQHPQGRCWQRCACRHRHSARPECEPRVGAEDQGEQGGVC